MSELILPISEGCHICRNPSTLSCKCDDENNPPFFLCEEHLFSHLERDGEHLVETIDPDAHPRYLIEEDEEALEQSKFFVRGHSRPITSMALYQKTLFTGEKDGLYHWNTKSNSLIKRIPLNCQVWSVATSEENYLVAAGLENNTILVFDEYTAKLKYSYQIHDAPVLALVFPRSGNYLISGSADGVQVIYNLKRSEVVSTEKLHSDCILCITVSSDDKFVITGSKSGEIVVWDIEKLKEDHKVISKKEPVPENKEEVDKDKKVVPEIKQPITALCCTYQKYLIYGGFEGIIRIWDMEKKQEEHKAIDLVKRRILSLAVTGDGNEIYASDNYGWIFKYGIKGEYLGNVCELNLHLTGLVLDENDHRLYAIMGGRTVRVFGANQSFEKLSLVGHDKLVSVRLTNDKKYLVGVYLDGGISFFDSKSGELEKDFENFYDAREILEEYSELGVKFEYDEY